MNKTRRFGFTLVELLIVVVIISILTAIAYPTYTNQVRKARRLDAEGVLMALSNVMEQDIAKTPNTGYGINDISPYSDLWSSLGNYYTFSLTNATVSSYTLNAIPTGSQSSDSCGTLSLTQSGVRSPSGNNCWK